MGYKNVLPCYDEAYLGLDAFREVRLQESPETFVARDLTIRIGRPSISIESGVATKTFNILASLSVIRKSAKLLKCNSVPLCLSQNKHIKHLSRYHTWPLLQVPGAQRQSHRSYRYTVLGEGFLHSKPQTIRKITLRCPCKTKFRVQNGKSPLQWLSQTKQLGSSSCSHASPWIEVAEIPTWLAVEGAFDGFCNFNLKQHFGRDHLQHHDLALSLLSPEYKNQHLSPWKSTWTNSSCYGWQLDFTGAE